MDKRFMTRLLTCDSPVNEDHISYDSYEEALSGKDKLK